MPTSHHRKCQGCFLVREFGNYLAVSDSNIFITTMTNGMSRGLNPIWYMVWLVVWVALCCIIGGGWDKTGMKWSISFIWIYLVWLLWFCCFIRSEITLQGKGQLYGTLKRHLTKWHLLVNSYDKVKMCYLHNHTWIDHPLNSESILFASNMKVSIICVYKLFFVWVYIINTSKSSIGYVVKDMIEVMLVIISIHLFASFCFCFCIWQNQFC